MVNTPCTEYNEQFPNWELCRICVSGADKIRQAGQKLLKKLSGQSDQDYENYLNRAVLSFLNFTGKTCEAYHGSVFSRAPIQTGETSEAFTETLKNVDAAGTSLDQFVSNIFWDALQTGWGGILVDHSPIPEGTPLAEAKGGAFLKWYAAESVINWRYSVIDGTSRLSLVVLREDRVEPLPDDEFTTEAVERYRVLSFDNGLYIQRIFEKSDKGEFIVTEEVIPKINGKPLTFLPFLPCPGEIPEKSLLLDLAVLNLGYYNNSADLENGLHYTAIPTPIAENMNTPTGQDGKPKDVKLGGTSMLFFKDPDGAVNVKYLEFVGAGLGQLMQAMDNKQAQMALIGMRALASDPKGVESAETATIHRASEQGILAATARLMSEKITRAVRLMAQWNNMEADAETFSYTLNTRYTAEDYSSAMLSLMLNARLQGEIPRKVFFDYMKEAQKIENMDYDEYEDLLEADKGTPHGPSGDTE